MVANSAVDVLGALAELELRRVQANHDQAEGGVVAMPRLDVRRRANPVDAGVLPDVDQDDPAAQCVDLERRRVYPALHVERWQLAGRADAARCGDNTEEQDGQRGPGHNRFTACRTP